MNIVEQLKYRKVIELIKKENFIELDRIDNSFKKINDMTKYKLKNYNK